MGPPIEYQPAGRGHRFRDCTGAELSTWHSYQGDRSDTPVPALNDWYWCELMSTDAAAAAEFYRAAFAYTISSIHLERIGQYFVLYKDEVPRAGILQNPHPETGSFWMPYVLVNHCDQTLTKAKELGAQVIVPAYDVTDVGRFAVLVDPAGAALGIVQRHADAPI